MSKKYTKGIGSTILCDGKVMFVDDILAALNREMSNDDIAHLDHVLISYAYDKPFSVVEMKRGELANFEAFGPIDAVVDRIVVAAIVRVLERDKTVE